MSSAKSTLWAEAFVQQQQPYMEAMCRPEERHWSDGTLNSATWILRNWGQYMQKVKVDTQEEFVEALMSFQRSKSLKGKGTFTLFQLYSNTYFEWLHTHGHWPFLIKLKGKWNPPTETREAAAARQYAVESMIPHGDEMVAILKYVKETYPDHYAPFNLMFNLAMRPSDVCSIRYGDFEASGRGEFSVMVNGKTEKHQRRRVPIADPKLWDTCMAHFGSSPKKEDWFFYHIDQRCKRDTPKKGQHTRMQYATARNMYREICKAVFNRIPTGLREARSGRITQLLNLNASSLQIRAVTGHKTDAMLERYHKQKLAPDFKIHSLSA